MVSMKLIRSMNNPVVVSGGLGAAYAEMKIIGYNPAQKGWVQLLATGTPRDMDLCSWLFFYCGICKNSTVKHINPGGSLEFPQGSYPIPVQPVGCFPGV